MGVFTIQFATILTLMFLSIFTYVAAKRFSFPYTIALVLLGIVLFFSSRLLPGFALFEHIYLTPDLLFYIFLPTLLFEAAYNIKLNRLLENIRAISLLAIFGLLLSVALTAFLLKFSALYLLGIDLPLIVALLFGAIISATDPVAVIALFKEYGAPKRLTLIFEGESLFNDGTAMALFLVLLSVLEGGARLGSVGYALFFEAAFSFLFMIIGGVVLGAFFGYLFSRALSLSDSINMQITIMLLMAHASFLLAEFINHFSEHYDYGLYVSAIITTAVASITMGNFGRFKLKPAVEHYTHRFWDYFAFLANSLVFILLGFLLKDILPMLDNQEILLIAILAILSVVVARALSVFLSLVPLDKSKERLPWQWKTLLAWGSLRGALAITMVLLLPDNLKVEGWPFDMSVKEFLLLLTILSMYFTLFVKALSIAPLMKWLKIGNFDRLESLEDLQAHAIVEIQLLRKLKELKDSSKINEETYNSIKSELERKLNTCKSELAQCEDEYKKEIFLSLHYYALGIEKSVLKDLYTKDEINDKVFRKYVSKLEKRKSKLISKDDSRFSFFEADLNAGSLGHFLGAFYRKAFFLKDDLSPEEKYLYYRALQIASKKIVQKMQEMLELDSFKTQIWSSSIKEIIKEYKEFLSKAKYKQKQLLAKHPHLINKEKELALRDLNRLQSKIIDDLLEKNLITDNVKNKFKV